MSNEAQQQQIVQTADAVEGSWVYRNAPMRLRPYLKLARMDRPVGTWLLLWPTWWAMILASSELSLNSLWYMTLFALGALFMRGAGCAWNDIIDRDFDGQVERTSSRPIPAGEISLIRAIIAMMMMALVGLFVLVQFNVFTVWLGMGSLVLIAIYPFMKRFTFWPQAWLGLTFNWGALVGWASITGDISEGPLILYAGCIAWTLGYDTIYAHQDKDDDMLIGVKSSALALGDKTKPALLVFYGLFFIALLSLVWLAKLGIIYYISLALAAAHLAWQVRTVKIDDADNCLHVFRANINFGWIIMLGLTLDRLFPL